jgi:hypothetical protein
MYVCMCTHTHTHTHTYINDVPLDQLWLSQSYCSATLSPGCISKHFKLSHSNPPRIAAYMYIHMHIYVHSYMHIHMHICTFICIYVHSYACMHIHMHICTFICMYAHSYAYMHIHMHVCTLHHCDASSGWLATWYIWHIFPGTRTSSCMNAWASGWFCAEHIHSWLGQSQLCWSYAHPLTQWHSCAPMIYTPKATTMIGREHRMDLVALRLVHPGCMWPELWWAEVNSCSCSCSSADKACRVLWDTSLVLLFAMFFSRTGWCELLCAEKLGYWWRTNRSSSSKAGAPRLSKSGITVWGNAKNHILSRHLCGDESTCIGLVPATLVF